MPAMYSEETTLMGVVPPHKEKLPFLKLFFMTMCFMGLQFGWALQIALFTPFILELGLSQTYVTLIWLCGPITGLFAQPLVGILSDKLTSRFGKRRPFIVLGAITIAVSLLLIPSALDIGYYLFHDKIIGQKPAAVILVVIFFWLLDLSNNLMAAPGRALIADMAPDEQQETGHAIASLWLSFGNITGYLAGFVPWSYYFPGIMTTACREACSNFRLSFLISIFVLTVTTIVTLFVATERPYTVEERQVEEAAAEQAEQPEEPVQPLTEAREQPDDTITAGISTVVLPPAVEYIRGTETTIATVSTSTSPPTNVEVVHAHKTGELKHLLNLFRKRPYVLIRLFSVTVFSWCGWYTFLIFITNWMGSIVFGGSPSTHKELYEQGVRWGSAGLAINSVLSLFTCLALPPLTKLLGPKPVYFVGQMILGMGLALTSIIREKYLAVALIAMFGIPWAVVTTVPNALVSIVAPTADKGALIGIGNIFVVLPQLIMSGVSPLLIEIGLKIHFEGVLLILLAGSICAFISAALVLLIKVDKLEKGEENIVIVKEDKVVLSVG